jgi:hypothetical protein
MKIKVLCVKHGDTMDGSGKPFFVEATDQNNTDRTVWEVDLSDMWCKFSPFDSKTMEYVPCEMKVEVLPE